MAKKTAKKSPAQTTKKAASATIEKIDVKKAPEASKTAVKKQAAAKKQETAKKQTASKKQETVKKRVPTKKQVNIAPQAARKKQIKEKAAEAIKEIRKDAGSQEPQNQENQSKINVLIAASEGTPFAVTGGLGEVIGSLPKAIMAEDSSMFDVRVVLPLYESIKYEDRAEMEFLGHFNVGLAWREQYCGVFRLTRDNVVYYFIDNEYYFKRNVPYGYYDDGERFAFFSKAVLDSIHLMDFQPQIIHSHDWQTALIPVYMKNGYQHLGAQSIFTIHNIEYQGKMGFDIIEDIFGLPKEAKSLLEYDNCVNLMKAAIESADLVNTVSPTYAAELRLDYYAKGLAPIIRKNEGKIRGILNGIDTESYNPATDKSIFCNYDAASIDKKKVNKAEMQRLLNLPVEENVPVIAVISRLVSHKGIDIVVPLMEELLSRNVQIVVLGIGESRYEDYFKWLQSQYPGKVSTMLCFNQDLARKIYAGADFFLMPSKAEPCGLAQMIASRYGTVPIVRKTGGLNDTIKDCSAGEGNGFVFGNCDSHDLMDAINRGLSVYHQKEQWEQLVKWVMAVDFSWKKSAKEYEKLYAELCSVNLAY